MKARELRHVLNAATEAVRTIAEFGKHPDLANLPQADEARELLDTIENGLEKRGYRLGWNGDDLIIRRA